jgi:hypothetical protein
MRISSEFVAADWHKLSFKTEDEWQRAISIFTARIRERFLDPITEIEHLDFAGFAVMALDCLLIEMLQQFREGMGRTPAGKSKDYFIDYLTNTSFGKYFDKRQATIFYRQIRCGILHQAELRGSSKIAIGRRLPLVKYADDNKGLIVNRHRFHRQLLTEFDNYVAQIRNPYNIEVRNKFIKKMRAICRTACEII